MTDATSQAIFKTGGKQYRVASGARVRVERLPAEVGDTVTFDEVYLVGVGDHVKVGTPRVPGAAVKATVAAHGRGKKLIVFKFRRRKGYQRKNGHRQDYTEIVITDIAG